MNSPKIPATVAILTRNSAATLRHALESVRDFDEIIVCDAASSDGTPDIARAYGARIIPQDTRYLSAEGRIINFAGVRNQTLEAATHDWYFFLDADEYLSPGLVEEIRAKVAGEPAAYWVPRKYVWQGKVVDCAVTYPSVQMRFFNRRVTGIFVKEVHERIELKPGVESRTLKAVMLVPVPATAAEMKAKWRRYLAIERVARQPMSAGTWLRVAAHEAAIAGLYFLRLARITLFCRGTSLPASFEFARVWYQWQLIHDSFATIKI